MEPNTLNHFKSVFVHRFFVEPADRDYAMARFFRVHGINDGFFWAALQALEKYLKAGLLVNGKDVRRSGHDLGKLHDEHVNVFGAMAVVTLQKPDDLDAELWRGGAVRPFIDKVQMYGSPHSRYGLSSWENRGSDLFELDQLSFQLRRLTVGLDWIAGDDWEVSDLPSKDRATYREVLARDASYQPRPITASGKPIDPAIQNMSDALHRWNFAFARSDEDLAHDAP